jgi:hypothetical protein
MASVVPDLIYDVGTHTGDDSVYYFRNGHQVVAIEANSTLVAAAVRRLRRASSRGHD